MTEGINNNSLSGLFNYDTYKLSTNNGIDTCGMFTYKYRLNKIAARWPAKAVAQFFYF